MRFLILQWVLISAITIHSILGVEGKKAKNQIEEERDEVSISERKYVTATRENKKFRSPELKYEEKSKEEVFTVPKKIRNNNVLRKDGDSEIRNGKKIKNKMFDSKILPEEINEDFTILKYKDKKHKDKKRRNLVEESNEISQEMEHEEPREKKQPTKLKYQPKEYQNKQRKGKAKLRENSEESQEKEEFEEEPIQQKKKKKNGKVNQLNENNASNDKHVTKHSVKEVQTKEFCRRIDSKENGCSEDTEEGSDMSEEEQVMSGIKKIKYSKKFAHEKSSKKQKNKEEENILKLHRKAESDVKTAKKLKKMRRIQDEDEESSEEIEPRRRLAVYEDEDDV